MHIYDLIMGFLLSGFATFVILYFSLLATYAKYCGHCKNCGAWGERRYVEIDCFDEDGVRKFRKTRTITCKKMRFNKIENNHDLR